MNVIIIDDEKHSHDKLKDLLKRFHPDVTVKSSAFSVKEGITHIKNQDPDLVFLDIMLPDGLGFDVIEALQPLTFQVIFITAHDEYAIRAIRAGALDYLLKPIEEEELQYALERARLSQSIGSLPTQEQVGLFWEGMKLFEEHRLPTRIAVSTLDGIVYQELEEILRLEADTNYTKFYTSNSPKPFVASLNLGEFEDQFEPYPNFMRVHRSHLINLRYVHKFIRKDRLIHMKDGSEVKISILYLRDFLKIMEKV